MRFPKFFTFLLAFLFGLQSLQAQLDRFHWVPPVVADISDSASNIRDYFMVISTPFDNANYEVRDGADVLIQSGTVSNGSPVTIQLGTRVNNVYTSITPGAGNIIGFEDFNTVNREGLTVTSDERVYVNMRERSNSQGASLTSKGCAGLGTEFRAGVMRDMFSPTRDFRNSYISVIAIEDGTSVTFDDFKPGFTLTGVPTMGSPATSVPVTVTLNKGESYTVGVNHPQYTGTADINDFNGTRVTSTKAIVVNSGTHLGAPLSSSSRDAGYDQIVPVRRAGTEYILVKGNGAATGANSPRESPMVVAAFDNTNVFVNGALTPINPTPLQAGDFIYLNGNWGANNIMYIETSEPAMMYQTMAGSDADTTAGFSYVPPLNRDISTSVDNIANIDQIGAATLRVITEAGSTVTFNGNTPANGPIPVPGNPDWEVYTQANMTGDVSVQSTSAVAASVVNLSGVVGAQGYFSGFPPLTPLVEIATTTDCFPGVQYDAVDPSGSLIQTFQWFNADGTPTGQTGATFTPPAPGDYFLRGFLVPTAQCSLEDSAVFTVPECARAELSIQKTVDPTFSGVGDPVTFTIEVTNNGPSPATEVLVEDILPDGYTYVANSINGGDVNSDASPAGSGLRWLFNSIPISGAGATQTVSFRATLNASGSYVNTATVQGEDLENDPSDNTSSATVTLAAPQLDIEKELVALNDLGAGNFEALYDISVTNSGNEAIDDLQITDAIRSAPNDFPAGAVAEVVSSTGVTLASPAFNGTSQPDLLAGTDSLAINDSVTLRIRVNFQLDASQPYQNQATASGTGKISNNFLSQPSNVEGVSTRPLASVRLDKTASPTVVDNGDGSFTASYTLEVTNAGNEGLENITLNDALTVAPSDFPTTGTTGVVISSTGGFSPNSNYDGVNDVNLLTGGVLAAGARGTLTYEVTFTPERDGSYTNTATVSADGVLSGSSDTDRDDAVIEFDLDPAFSLEKQLTSLVDNGGGQFTATFELKVKNTGNEALTNLSINDNIFTSPNDFPTGSTASVTGSSANLTTNGSFDGENFTALLNGVNSLDIAEEGTITIQVVFTADANAPYQNQASIRASGSLSSQGVSGVSDNPDSASLADPTPVTPSFNPDVVITKTADEVISLANGEFQVTYILNIENTGNEPLNAVQITDDLINGSSDFPATGTTGTILTTSAGLTSNANYDGVSNTTLLAGTDTLAVQGSESVTLRVNFTPTRSGDFNNFASVAGTGDFSSNQANDAVDTPVAITLPYAPELTLEKNLVGAVTDNNDGSFTATFQIVATNTGNEPLENLQIEDAIQFSPNTFPANSTASITSQSGLTINPSYNGVTNATLLSGADSLAVNATGSVTIEVNFTPDGNQPYQNQARARAEGEFSGNSVGAFSDDPADGTSATDPTFVNPPLDPSLTLTKALDNIVDNDDGTFTAQYTLVLTNTGNEPIANLQVTDDLLNFPNTFPATGTTGVVTAVSSGLSLANSPAYNGTTAINTLTGSDILDLNGVETISLEVTFTPDGQQPYLNRANVTGNGQFSNTFATALSDDPATAGVQDGTSTNPPLTPEVVLEKTLVGIDDLGGGNFRANFELEIENTGNEPVEDIQITDAISSAPNTFPTGSTATVTGATGLTVNTTQYNGGSNPNLLSGLDSLPIGGKGSVFISVEFEADANSPYLNQASANVVGSFSTSSANDLSDDPTNPAGNDDATEVAPQFTPEVELTKNVDSVVVNATEIEATITFTVTNTGNEPLTSVQIIDDVTVAPSNYPAATVGQVISTTGGLSENAAFNGTSVTSLLTGTDTLAIGEGGTVTVRFTFPPQSGQTEYLNQAQANVAGEYSGDSASEVSDDPDTPAADNDPTVTRPDFVAELSLTKSLTSIQDLGDGQFKAVYDLVVSNSGSDIIDSLQIEDSLFTAPNNFPSGAVGVVTNFDGLTPNAAPYDGSANINLLSGTDSLAVSETKTLSIEVTFDADGNSPYLNQASVSGTGQASGDADSAISDDPATTAPSDATTATPPFTPAATLLKELASVTDNEDGTFTALYSFTVTNTGNEPLENIQIADAISTAPNTFPTGAVARITGISGLTQNTTAYDGVSVTNLLAGTDALAINGSATVNIEVDFTPDGNQPYLNQATLSATGEFSTDPVTDLSDDPADATSDDDVTEAAPTLVSSAQFTKIVNSIEHNGDGSFTVSYTITVENNGNQPLENLTLSDSVSTAPSTYPAGSTARLITATGLNVLNTFNGTTQPQILDTGNTLPVGGERSVTIEIDFTPEGNQPYVNQASFSADGSFDSTTVNRNSNDPDTADAGDPTVANFTLDPTLSLAKTLEDVSHQGDGVFQARFRLVLTNTGNEQIDNLQITDAVTSGLSTFPAGSTAEVVSLSSGLTANPTAFDGVTQTSLLAGTDSLGVADSETILITVDFTPDGNQPYVNQATATGEGAASGDSVSETSDDDGTGNDGTSVTPDLTPELDLVKTLDRVDDLGFGQFKAVYTLNLSNTGNEVLTNVQITDNILNSPSSFPAGSTAAVTGLTSGLNSASVPYDGTTQANVLSGTDSIAVGANESVTLEVTFDADGAQSYFNSANAQATGQASSDPAVDASDDPSTGVNGDATPVTPTYAPNIESTKSNVNLADNGDGTFTALYDLTVQNIGNEPVTNLQITDDLDAAGNTFPTDAIATIVTIDSGLTANPLGFDGVNQNEVLAGIDALEINESKTVQISVSFTGDGTGAYLNQITASAEGSNSGSTVSDLSDDPSTGTPDDATAVTPNYTPVMEISKNLDLLEVDNGTGEVRVVYTIVVCNAGTEPLTSVQVVDDFTAGGPGNTFPANVTGSVTATSPNLTAATTPAFDGTGNTNMLTGADILAVGEKGSITLDLTFLPDTRNPQEYFNQATASGIGQYSTDPDSEVSDDPDTAVDNDPTSATPNFFAELQLEKTLVGGLTDNGDGTFTARYQLDVTNISNQPVNAVQITDALNVAPNNFPTNATVSIFSATGLTAATGANAYDGFTNVDLLDGSDVLAINEVGTIIYDLTFTPTQNVTYRNQAEACATGVNDGEFECDLSDDPTTTDVEDATVVSPVLIADIEATKALDSIVHTTGGVFDATYTITVTNTGNQALKTVQVQDDLLSAPNNFPTGTVGEIVATSANLTAATGAVYDGTTNVFLLDGNDTLGVNESGTITLKVSFTPDGNQPFSNQATVSGQGDLDDVNASDLSDDPTDATSTDDVTLVTPPFEPEITLTKEVIGAVVDNADGSFTATVRMTASNTGNEALEDIQITDAISAAPNDFPAGSSAVIVGSSSNFFIATAPVYDGASQPNLLTSNGNTLNVGESGDVTVEITFTPDLSESYFNQATATAEGVASNQNISDLSDDPATAAAADDATEIIAPLVPAVELTKSAGVIRYNGDGSFTSTYTIELTNSGNETLNNLQVVDAISTGASTFPAGSSAVIAGSSNLNPNSSYDGVSVTDLLAAGNALSPSESGTITIEVQFTPDGNQPYVNEASASAEGRATTDAASDISDDPTTPVVGDPTTVDPPLVASLDLTKELIGTTDLGGGTFRATYLLSVTNTGNEALNNVQIIDDIINAPSNFPAGSLASVTATTGGLNANSAYNGTTVTSVLSGTDSISVNSGGTATIDVTFTADGAANYLNQANASATGGASGDPAVNTSDDPNSTDGGDPTTVTPPYSPSLEVTKTDTQLIDNGDGTFTAEYDIELTNNGNEPLQNIQVTDDLDAGGNTFPADATATLVSVSSGLTANANPFDGTTEVNILDGSDTLAIGAIETISVSVTFTGDGTGAYLNQATGSGAGTSSGVLESQISDDPDTATEDDATAVTPTYTTALELDKNLDSFEILTDGSGLVRGFYTFTLCNTGTEPVTNLQVLDNLTTAPSDFPAGVVAEVITTSANLTEATTTPYNGTTNDALLEGSDTLAVGEKGSITVRVEFPPTPGIDDYTNQAELTGEGQYSGDQDSEVSNDPDTMGVDNDTTLMSLPFFAELDTQKELVGALVDNGNGTFTATYKVTVTNLGNQGIGQVQITDALTVAPNNFPANSTVSIVSTNNLTEATSPAYDGITNVDLLAGTDVLPINGSGEITYEVTFTPVNTDPILNQVTACGEGVQDFENECDLSDDPNTPDVEDAVSVSPILNEEMTLTKTLNAVNHVGNGIFEADFTVTVSNTGNQALANVQIRDDLFSVPNDFPTGSTASVTSLSNNLTATTSAYDGNAQPLFLSGNDSLAVGAAGTVDFTVSFTPDGNQPYTNQAAGTALGQLTNRTTSDMSDDPTTTDANDGTLVEPIIVPELTLIKELTGIVDNNDSSFTATMVITATNTGNEALDSVQIIDTLSSSPNDFPAGTTASVVSTSSGFTAATSPAYNGLNLNQLLAPNQSLAVGQAETVTIEVTFTPTQESHFNQASASGEGVASGNDADAVSDDPNTPTNEDSTEVTPPFNTDISITKVLENVQSISGEQFAATYTLTATNNSNQAVTDVQIVDSVSTGGNTFPAGSTAVASNPTGGLLLNSSYDGANVTDVLAPGNTLAFGESGSVTITVNFTRDANVPYQNTATVSANGVVEDSGSLGDSGAPTDVVPPSSKAPTYAEFISDNSLNPTTSTDGSANEDLDLYSNALEYAFCTDPNDGESKKAYCVDYDASGNVFAQFTRRRDGHTDVNYILEGRDNISDSPAVWFEITSISESVDTGVSVPVDSELVTFNNINLASEFATNPALHGFVRLRVEVDTNGDGVISADEIEYSQVFGWDSTTIQPGCQTFSNPFVDKECFSGTILGASGTDNQILDLSSSVDVANGGISALIGSASNLYIEVLSGTYEGHRFEIDEAASTPTEIVLEVGADRNTLDPIPADLLGLVAVRAHRTLDTLASPDLFTADDDPTVGGDDNRLRTYKGGVWNEYWVYDDAGTIDNQWTDIADTSFNDVGNTVVIPPGQGVFIDPKAAPVAIPTIGVVREWKFANPMCEGYNLVGSAYPLNQTPESRAMTSDPFLGTNDPGTADQIHLWRGDQDPTLSGYDTYFDAEFGTAIDYWTNQESSALPDNDASELFIRSKAAFIDVINANDKSDPANVWTLPVPWTE